MSSQGETLLLGLHYCQPISYTSWCWPPLPRVSLYAMDR